MSMDSARQCIRVPVNYKIVTGREHTDQDPKAPVPEDSPDTQKEEHPSEEAEKELEMPSVKEDEKDEADAPVAVETTSVSEDMDEDSKDSKSEDRKDLPKDTEDAILCDDEDEDDTEVEAPATTPEKDYHPETENINISFSEDIDRLTICLPGGAVTSADQKSDAQTKDTDTIQTVQDASSEGNLVEGDTVIDEIEPLRDSGDEAERDSAEEGMTVPFDNTADDEDHEEFQSIVEMEDKEAISKVEKDDGVPESIAKDDVTAGEIRLPSTDHFEETLHLDTDSAGSGLKIDLGSLQRQLSDQKLPAKDERESQKEESGASQLKEKEEMPHDETIGEEPTGEGGEKSRKPEVQLELKPEVVILYFSKLGLVWNGVSYVVGIPWLLTVPCMIYLYNILHVGTQISLGVYTLFSQ